MLKTLLLLIATLTAHAQTDPTYAEKLGFPKGKKVIVLHIDDAGMSLEANRGTIRALEAGLARSTSVMMPCAWVPAFMEWAKANPTADVGVHLTLTAEWRGYRWQPLAGRAAVPGLHDGQGSFWPAVADVVQHATADEVETEIRAQIARFRQFGVQPTHLDSHMGTLFQPKFVQRYVKVAIEEKIPALFPGGHATLIGEASNLPAPMRQFIQQMGQQLWNAGLPVFDDLDGTSYGWTPPAGADDKAAQALKTDKFIDLLNRARPGLTYVIMHCADAGDAFRAISDSGPTRRGDMLAMLDPRLRAHIEKEGIIVTTCRELMERRRAVK